MWLSKYRLKRLASAGFISRSRPGRRTDYRRRVPLSVELLEDRTTPATITPTTFADGVGIGSLRDAILQANGNSQNNTIVLSAGTYQLSVAGRDESAGQTGDLNLTAFGQAETIQGAGAGVTVINANQIDRVFEILSGVTVNLSNLTITGGLATDTGAINGADGLGGGILNDGGTLTLDHVDLTGNSVQPSRQGYALGGGLFNMNGTVTLDNCIISNNAAHAPEILGALGGGVYSNGGTLTISDSTIGFNVALGGRGPNGFDGSLTFDASSGAYGGEAAGGGLYVTNGSLTITASEIVNNLARAGNGGNGGNGATIPPGVTPRDRVSAPFYTGPHFTTGPFVTAYGFTNDGFTNHSPAATTGFFTLRASSLGFPGGGGGSGGNALGGGLYVSSGSVHIGTTNFTGNQVAAGNGGNSGNPGAGAGSISNPPINGGFGAGGGIYVAEGNVDLVNSSVTGNSLDQSAGGGPGIPSRGFIPPVPTPISQGPDLYIGGGTVHNAGSVIADKDKVGVVRPGAGGAAVFSLDSNGDGQYDPTDAVFTFGLATDTFLTGDWNGDGTDKIGVVRPDGNGSLVFSLDTNGDGGFDAGDRVFHFGQPGDQVIVGDWNGAGKDEIGVVRPDDNGGLVFSLDTNGDGVFDAGDQVFDFGTVGDHVIIGDWSGDGRDKIGVVRPDGNGSLVWSLDTNGNGVFDAADQVYHFGAPGDQPIVGDWNGDGKDKIGVYRTVPQETLSFSLDADGNGVFDPNDEAFDFGLPGDQVVIGKWGPVGQPLQAAYAAPEISAPSGSLTTAELAPLVNEATAMWMATGLDAQQIQNLQNETVAVGALPNGFLGYTQGESITVSPNAAGFGWYVDPAGAGNTAFPTPTPQGLQAVAGSAAAGRMDLLTTILHEEGHVLGLPDLNPSISMGDVMTESLSPGLRRLPRPGEAASVGQT